VRRNNGDLKLVVEGEVFRPEDELRGLRQHVRIAEPQKAETQRVVEAWNEVSRPKPDEQKQ
jgi:hypothetical protein